MMSFAVNIDAEQGHLQRRSLWCLLQALLHAGNNTRYATAGLRRRLQSTARTRRSAAPSTRAPMSDVLDLLERVGSALHASGVERAVSTRRVAEGRSGPPAQGDGLDRARRSSDDAWRAAREPASGARVLARLRFGGRVPDRKMERLCAELSRAAALRYDDVLIAHLLGDKDHERTLSMVVR